MSNSAIANHIAPMEQRVDRKLSRSDSSITFLHAPDAYSDISWKRGAILAGFDFLAVVVAAFVGLSASVVLREMFSATQPLSLINSQSLAAAVIIPALVLIVSSSNYGHYTRIKPFWTEAREIVSAIAYAGAVTMFFVFIAKTDVSRIWLISGGLFLIFFAPMMRAAGKLFLSGCNRWYAPLIVAGDPELIRECKEAIESDKSLGYSVAVEVDATAFGTSENHSWSDLSSTLRDVSRLYRRPRLLLAFDFRDHNETRQTLMESLREHYEHVIVAKSMYGVPAMNSEVVSIDKYDTLFFRFQSSGISFHKRVVKRAVDIVGSGLALVVLSPLLLVLSLIVRSDGGKAFYGSERIGLNGRRFKCLKIRSMSENGDSILRDHLEADPAAKEEWFSTFKLTNDPRITSVGHLIRRTSLDELPQFYNVLRGDMSLVGPRPILPEEVDSYGQSLSLYQGVRPGVTGLWQVSGRSDLEYEERVKLNKWYVRNWSIWLDFSILVRTIPAVLGSSGAR